MRITNNNGTSISSVQSLSHVRLCDPMNRSMPGLSVHHQLLESTQTNVHQVDDAISSSVIPFSSCPQSFPASESFQMSQLFPSGGQSIGVSASTSALPINTQDWSPLGWTGWTSLQSKGEESRDPYLLHSQQGQYVGKGDCWNHAFLMLHIKKALMMGEVFG